MANGVAGKGLERAGGLIILGLVIQLFTLFFVHPMAFMGFAGLGCTLVLLGVVWFGVTMRARGK